MPEVSHAEGLVFDEGVLKIDIDTERVHLLSDFIAGCLAGSAGTIAGYPFDTIKVRQQTISNLTSEQHAQRTSFIRTAHHVFHKQGPRMLYAGMAYPMISEGFRGCLYFGVYGKLLALDTRGRHNQPNYVEIASAGAVAAAVQGVVATPVELVKIQMQSHKGAGCFSSAGQCVRYLYRMGGLRSLFHGTTITMVREVPALSIYMTSYTSMRRVLTPEGHRHPSLWLDLLAGGIAGMASWIATIPLDVLKTRIQSDDPAKRQYLGIRHCLITSWRADGIRVFWRGLGATCLRAFPTNAVTLVVYSKSLSMLQDLD